MADEKNPTGPQFQDAQGKVYKAVAVGVKPEIFSQDVVLEDGSVLRLHVLVTGVFRAEGVTDALGLPIYNVQATVLPTLKKPGGGS